MSAEISSPMAAGDPPKARGLRRRLARFSMRTLLVLMSVCCVAMGAWTVYVQPYRAQSASLAHVLELGGTVQSVSANGPAWQRPLVESMVGSKQFIHVEKVDFRGLRVSAADVSALSGLRYLKSLYLDRAEVNDGNIGALAAMTALEDLSLVYTQISDSGLSRLAGLTKLRTLYLTGVPITDASVPTLAARPSLRELYIRWTKISSDGALRLVESLPECAVHHHEIQPTAAVAGNADGVAPPS